MEQDVKLALCYSRFKCSINKADQRRTSGIYFLSRAPSRGATFPKQNQNEKKIAYHAFNMH